MKKTVKTIPNRATALRDAEEELAQTSDTARLDAELLLCETLNISRTHLATWPEKGLDEHEHRQYQALIERRSNGEPIAYILGSQDFWTLELITTPNVLIPRPETELLVEAALERLAEKQSATIIDIGTGSGAIALSIAKEKPSNTVIGTDISKAAISVAAQNKNMNNIDNTYFIHGKWSSNIKNESCEMIVSNPPYIAQNDQHLTLGDIRFEPNIALVSGKTGFEDIDKIIQDSQRTLKKNGWLLFEHGWEQGPQSQQKLKQAGYQNVMLLKDLNGNDRVSIGQKN